MASKRDAFDANNAYGSARNTYTVVPHDTTNFAIAGDAVYVGVSGNITLINDQGAVQLFSNVPVGILPVRFLRINNTATTATNMVALICS